MGQSAFKSFFLRQAEGEFDLTTDGNLWALLVEITLRKCGKWRTRFRAGKRDLGREQPLPPPSDQSSGPLPLAAESPGPEEPVILAELLEHTLRGLDEQERRMIELKQQGYAVAEISAQVGRSEFTVYQVLKRVKKRLQRMCADE